MIDEATQEVASLYVLELLTQAETSVFEESLRSNEELRTFVTDLQETTANLALQAPPLQPPAALKNRILADIRGENQQNVTSFKNDAQQANRSGSWLSFIPWAVAAGLTLTCGVLLKQRTQLKEEVTVLEQRNAVSEMTIATLSSMGTGAPNATGVVVWDREKQQGVLTIEKMPKHEANKDYQLWIVDPKYPAPVDAGVFNVDDNGISKVSFKPNAPVNSAQKFAISVEPKGGSQKASGPIILISK